MPPGRTSTDLTSFGVDGLSTITRSFALEVKEIDSVIQ